MINNQNIKGRTPLEKSSEISNNPSVYLVYSNDECIYIGQSKNPKKRWKNHHHMYDFKKFENVQIEVIEHQGDLELLEESLIKKHNPVLNHRKTKYDEPKRQRSVAVTETGWTKFKSLAKEHGLSISDLIEKIARKELVVDDDSSHL